MNNEEAERFEKLTSRVYKSLGIAFVLLSLACIIYIIL